MNRKRIERFLMIVFITGLTVYYWQDYRAKKRIEKKYKETVGIIVDYYELFPATHYLTYEYTVNSRTFRKKINPDNEFKSCPDTKDCIGRKFLVRYEYENPDNSTILLDSNRAR